MVDPIFYPGDMVYEVVPEDRSHWNIGKVYPELRIPSKVISIRTEGFLYVYRIYRVEDNQVVERVESLLHPFKEGL